MLYKTLKHYLKFKTSVPMIFIVMCFDSHNQSLHASQKDAVIYKKYSVMTFSIIHMQPTINIIKFTNSTLKPSNIFFIIFLIRYNLYYLVIFLLPNNLTKKKNLTILHTYTQRSTDPMAVQSKVHQTDDPQNLKVHPTKGPQTRRFLQSKVK